jgi:hypothetical protein
VDGKKSWRREDGRSNKAKMVLEYLPQSAVHPTTTHPLLQIVLYLVQPISNRTYRSDCINYHKIFI